MREAQAGETVETIITHLEMGTRPDYPWPPAPSGPPLALMQAQGAPAWYFLALYDAVGAPYEWTDWHAAPAADLAEFVGDPQVELYTLFRSGWPAGFFMLDCRRAGVCDLAYFGLVPEATGLGLGPWLLRTAIHMGWEREGVVKLTVNTCTLDHPAALPLYQKAGFVPVDRETRTRVLTRPRLLPE